MRRRLTVFLWALLLFGSGIAQAAEPRPSIDRLITNGGFIVTSGDTVLASHHPHRGFIPASTIKIATGLLALETLGPDFRFTTEFYLRENKVLVIKGFGDPFLVSESIPPIAAALRQRGVTRIESLVLDQSFFSVDSPVEGSENSRNPYDAENGALAVNFNALPILVERDGRVKSGEMQTPLLPLMTEIGGQLPPGKHRVNVTAYETPKPPRNVDRYAAELLATQFLQAGLETSVRFERGTVRQADRLVYSHESEKSVADLVRSSLKYSNNFMANQLFLASGAARFGPPADWRKGQGAMAAMLQDCCGIAEAQMRIVEGSGLSRHNRATPGAMLALLRAFSAHRDLLPVKETILLKSGTLQGVYNYAGYFSDGSSADPFVLFLNQPANTRRKLLGLLEQIHRDANTDSGGASSP